MKKPTVLGTRGAKAGNRFALQPSHLKENLRLPIEKGWSGHYDNKGFGQVRKSGDGAEVYKVRGLSR